MTLSAGSMIVLDVQGQIPKDLISLLFDADGYRVAPLRMGDRQGAVNAEVLDVQIVGGQRVRQLPVGRCIAPWVDNEQIQDVPIGVILHEWFDLSEEIIHGNRPVVFHEGHSLPDRHEAVFEAAGSAYPNAKPLHHLPRPLEGLARQSVLRPVRHAGCNRVRQARSAQESAVEGLGHAFEVKGRDLVQVTDVPHPAGLRKELEYTPDSP